MGDFFYLIIITNALNEALMFHVLEDNRNKKRSYKVDEILTSCLMFIERCLCSAYNRLYLLI